MRRFDMPAPPLAVDVTVHGDFPPGTADYARDKIGRLSRFARGPVLAARVRLTRHGDPAVPRPVVAQANLDVNGQLVRAQVDAVTAAEATDRLQARLRRGLERLARPGETPRGRAPAAQPAGRPAAQPAHLDRKVLRHKAFALPVATVDEAEFDMGLLDYDFHLFTEAGTGQDSVLYRGGETGYRLAQVRPPRPDLLSTFRLPLTISPQPAPALTIREAVQRLEATGLPFLFFLDADRGRGSVLYHRYDGHYGLITPAT